jgi:hypothetical protein
MKEARSASHLQSADFDLIEKMLQELITKGYIKVNESTPDRFNAVAGLQWVMEKILRGTEFIITPDRATPFKTHGDENRPPTQVAREAVLLERLKREDPVCLIFCKDGEGTPDQNEKYLSDIFEKYGCALHGKNVLFEYKLPISRQEFPPELSGAMIISNKNDETLAFAIRAAQFDKTTNGKTLELYYGNINVDAYQGSASVAGRRSDSIDGIIGEWDRYMKEQIGIDYLSMCFK